MFRNSIVSSLAILGMKRVLWNLIDGEQNLKNHQGIHLWAIFTTSKVFFSSQSAKKLWNCSSLAFLEKMKYEPLMIQEAIYLIIEVSSFPFDVTAHPRLTKAYISLYHSLKSWISLGYTLEQIDLILYLISSYIGR